MKLRNLRSPLGSLVAAALILALPLLGSAAPPRGGGAPHGAAPHGGAPAFHGGGGGFHPGGGFGGGSFRAPAPSAARGPRGGAVVHGPLGGTAVRGPHGGEAFIGHGGERGYHPGYYPGGAYYGGPAYGGWAPYYGPDYGASIGAAIAGVIAALAIGTVLASLPAAAAPQEYEGQTYYYDGTNYYQACYQGTELDYCVVPNPYGP